MIVAAARCTVLLLLAGSIVPARAQEPPPAAAPAVSQGALEPGRPAERQLAGGSADVYDLRLDANQFCYLWVDQDGVDVVLRAWAPDGTRLQEADQPNGLTGPERVVFVTGAAGVYRLEVRALDPKAAAGRYAARVEQLRAAAPDDAKRVEAMRLDDAAKLLAIQRTAPKRREMIDGYTRAAALWHELGEFDEEAVSLNEAGLGWRSLSMYPEAIALLERSVAAYRAAGDRKGEGLALNNLGFAYDSWGEKPKALEYYTAAAECYRATGNVAAEARSLANIAKTCADIGERERALELNTVALERLRAAGDVEWIASASNNLGSLFMRIGELQLARTHLDEALALFEKTNRRRGAATALNNLGRLNELTGDYDRALEYHQRALEIWRQLNNPVGAATALTAASLVMLAKGEPARAVELLDRALPLYASNPDRAREAFTRLVLGQAYARLGDRAKAGEQLTKAAEMARAVSVTSAMGASARLDETELAISCTDPTHTLVDSQAKYSVTCSLAPNKAYGILLCRQPLVEFTAERAAVSALGASCETPVGLCARHMDGTLAVAGYAGLPDGSEWVRDAVRGDPEQPAALGLALAERLMAAGAGEILARARAEDQR